MSSSSPDKSELHAEFQRLKNEIGAKYSLNKLNTSKMNNADVLKMARISELQSELGTNVPLISANIAPTMPLLSTNASGAPGAGAKTVASGPNALGSGANAPPALVVASGPNAPPALVVPGSNTNPAAPLPLGTGNAALVVANGTTAEAATGPPLTTSVLGTNGTSASALGGTGGTGTNPPGSGKEEAVVKPEKTATVKKYDNKEIFTPTPTGGAQYKITPITSSSSSSTSDPTHKTVACVKIEGTAPITMTDTCYVATIKDVTMGGGKTAKSKKSRKSKKKNTQKKK